MALCATMTSFPLLQIFSNKKKKDGKNGKQLEDTGTIGKKEFSYMIKVFSESPFQQGEVEEQDLS